MHGVKKEARTAAKAAEDAAKISEYCANVDAANAARREVSTAQTKENKKEKEKRKFFLFLSVCFASRWATREERRRCWRARSERWGRTGRWSEETLQRELRLTARCLSSNPKLYCVW